MKEDTEFENQEFRDPPQENLGKRSTSGRNKEKVIMTGHSLGGGLARIVGTLTGIFYTFMLLLYSIVLWQCL